MSKLDDIRARIIAGDRDYAAADEDRTYLLSLVDEAEEIDAALAKLDATQVNPFDRFPNNPARKWGFWQRMVYRFKYWGERPWEL